MPVQPLQTEPTGRKLEQIWTWHQLHQPTEGLCPWAAGMAAEKASRGVCLSAHVPEALAGSFRGALLALEQLAFGVQDLLNVPDTAGCKPHFPP